MLPSSDRHELQTLAGLAYQRHALYLHGLFNPKAAEFVATNKLGYSRGSVDRELGALAKDLQGATQAELLARLAEVAERMGARLALPQEAQSSHGSLPTRESGAITQLDAGTRDAVGTDDGTYVDVEPESS